MRVYAGDGADVSAGLGQPGFGGESGAELYLHPAEAAGHVAPAPGGGPPYPGSAGLRAVPGRAVCPPGSGGVRKEKGAFSSERKQSAELQFIQLIERHAIHCIDYLKLYSAFCTLFTPRGLKPPLCFPNAQTRDRFRSRVSGCRQTPGKYERAAALSSTIRRQRHVRRRGAAESRFLYQFAAVK